MDVFELVAKLRLDSSEYKQGLSNAKTDASKNLGSASKVLGKLNDGVNKVLAVGAAAAGAAVAGMTAFAKASVQTGMQFDGAMAQVAATMGTTVDQIGDLRDFAKQMGATTAFSATQAAEALNYMALAGYDSETSMATLPTVLNLAAAGSMDLATASDMVTDAQSALGLTLPETTEMVDQMAAAASKSNTSVSQLGEAFLTIGATARNLKGGTVELSTVLGVLADNGIKGAEGGTHLRNMILSLQNPTKDAAKQLKKLKISVYDGNGEMRSMVDIVGDLQKATEGMDQASRDAIVSGIFNKTDLAAVNALLGTPIDRFHELESAIKDSKGAAEEMANTQLDNLAGDITLLKSAAEGAKIAFSDGLTPALRDIVQRVTKVLSKKSTQKALTDIGKKIGDVAKTLTNKLGNALPRILSLFDDGGKKLKIFGAAFGAFVIAVKAAVNPIGAVVTALGLMAAAIGVSALTADEAKKKYSSLSEEQYNNVEATLDSIDAYKSLKDSREDQNASIDSETERTKDLWSELQNLADANGNVTDENKERAQYILGELNSALGTEYEMNGNVIQSYQEMQSEIAKLIEMRRAERKLQAAEESYDAAKDGLKGVSETIFDLTNEISNAEEKIAGYREQIAALGSEGFVDDATAAENAAKFNELTSAIEKQNEVLKARQTDLEAAKEAERQYHEDIQAYEQAELAFSQGYYEQVNQLLDKDTLTRAQHAIESGNISEEQFNALKRNADVAKAELERYQQNLADGTDGYTEEEMQKLADHVSEIEATLQEASKLMSAEGTEGSEGFNTNLNKGLDAAVDTADQKNKDILSKITKPSLYRSSGSSDASAWVSGYNSSLKGVKYFDPDANTFRYASAIGIDFVPYNGYPVSLHRGEAVLTAREAEEWRKGGGSGGDGTKYEINQYIETVPQTPVELADATAAAFERFRWAV